MKSGLDHARILTEKADSDLRVCEISHQYDGPLDVVAFNLQQAAEKLLKALLAARTIVYPKTHDLDELMNLLPADFSMVLSFRERISGWTAYAVDIRYLMSTASWRNGRNGCQNRGRATNATTGNCRSLKRQAQRASGLVEQLHPAG